MAAKNRCEAYKEQKAAKQSNGQPDSGTKINRLEEYKAKNGGKQTYADIYKVANNIVGRVNAWLKNHNNYIKDYQSRYSGRKYSYEDAYVSDSGDWLDTVSKQKSTLKTEAESILAYVDQFSDYLDAGWVRSVRDTLIGANQQQKSIVAGATKDNEWWGSFGSEDMVKQYGSAEEAYKAHQRHDGYSKKYNGMTYANLEDLWNSLDDGEEKDWLTSHKASVYRDEMLKYDVAGNEENLGKLEQILSQYDNLRQYYDAYQKNPDAYSGSEYENLRTMADIFSQYQQTFGSKKELEKLVHDTRLNINNAKRIQKNAELASVADSTSKTYDPEFGKYSSYVSDGETPLIPDYKDIAYDAVNGNTDSLGLAVGQSRFGTISGSELQRLDAIRHMNEDEKALYNYYHNKYGYEAAEEYLDTIIDSLNYLHGKKLFEPMENKWLLEELFGIAAGFDQFHSGVTSFLSGDDYIPTSAMQYASGMVREDLADNSIPMWYNFKIGKWEDKILGNSLGQGVYDLITTTSNMAPSILTSMAVGAINPTAGVAAGNALMGVSSAGNAYQEALNLGYDKGQARVYSTLVGASEVGLQYLIGGIGKLGGKLSGKAATSLASKFDNAYARLAVKYGTNMLSEGAEEYLQEVLTPVFKNFALGTDEEISLITEDAIYSFLLGAISSGFMEGTGISSENGKGLVGNIRDISSKNQKNIDVVKQYGGSTKELIEEGLKSESGSESRQLAEMMKRKTGRGKEMSGYEIRSLVEANEAQFAVEDYDLAVKTAREKLTKLGESKNIDKIAKLVAKKVTGQELTRAEIKTLVNSFGSQVAKEMTRPVVETQSGPKSYNATYKSLEDRVGTESRFGVSDSGTATIRKSNEEISLDNVEVVKTEDGQLTVKLADGQEMYAGDIDFADDTQAYAFSAVADIENITPAAATAILRDLDLSKPVGAQLNGIDEAYTYGYHGYSEADLKAGQYTSNLTNEQMMSAYKLGQSARKISDDSKVDAYKKMRTAAEAIAEKNASEGKATKKAKNLTISFNKGNGEVVSIEDAGITDAKKSGGGKVAEILHKMGLGTRVEFFESYLSETMTVTDKKTGKVKPARVFINDQGVEQIAYSGVYRKADGTIRVDLNAYNGRGLTLNALAHELTHFIQQWSDRKYRVLADFLMKEYEKTDMTMHERVLKEQKRLEDIRGEEISYDEAYNEVVANAMSKMFDDGSLVEKLAKLKEQDKNLAQKLWEGFKKILAKFIGIYEKEGALFKDAADLVAMKETFEQLQNMFAEALVEASENYQASLTLAESQTLTEAGKEVRNQQSSQETDFDYSALNWATELGIISGKDRAIFERTINNEIYRGAEPQSANGEYIIDTGKCLMFTDGDFHNPTLSRVIVFATEYESLLDEAKRRILYEARSTGDVQESQQVIEDLYGPGFAVEYTQTVYSTDARQNRGRKGANGQRGNRGYRAKSLKERLAEEGLDHLLEEDAEVYSSQETDRDYLHAVNRGDMKTAQKMVDEAAKAAGYTIKAYHGTDAESFSKFDKGKIGSATGVSILGDGFYFADSKKTAQQYGKNVYAVYLKQANPYLATDSDAYRLKSVDIERQGHDGVALSTSKGKVYMILDPNQIKSAEPATYDNDGNVIPLSKRFDKANDDIRYSSQETDADAEGFKDYDIVSAVYTIRNEKAKRGHDLVKIGSMPTFYRKLFGVNGDVYVSNEHLYQNMVSKATAEAEGRYNADDSADYHELGEGKIINAIEQFQNPLVIMESLKDYKEPRLVAVLDEKGNDGQNLLAVMELYAPLRPHGISQLRNHVLITIYEKNSLPNYIEKTVDKNRILHKKEGSQLTSQAGLRLAGEMSNETLKKNVARFNKKVKAFKEKNKIFYSSQETDLDSKANPYSYNTLVGKPDMVVTTVSSNIPKNRADVVYQAKQNAAKVGVIDPKTGSVSVHVDDIGVDVLLGTDGLKHGLRRTKDAQNDANYIVTLKAGEIIKNSIKVNEMTPKKADAKVSLVLIGVARNLNGDTYVVRSIVNSFSNELTSIDVLYAINAKKELAAIKSPRFTAEPLSETSSTISIAELLDLVNQYFPDVLPEDVLKHYGYYARPEGDLGDGMLYSEHDIDYSNRALLANAFEGLSRNSDEYKMIQEYKGKIDLVNAEERKLRELNEQIKELSFVKGPRDTAKIRQLRDEAIMTANRISIYDKQLLRLEASAPLQRVLEREKKQGLSAS